MKQHEHKESDVGEVSSPGSEDNHNHRSFSTEGEGKEEIEKERNFQSLTSVEGSGTEIVAQNIVLEKSVLGSEKEIKIEDVFYGEDRRYKHDEAVRKSYAGGSSGSRSSSSSSSDNESHDIEDNQAQADSLSGMSVKANHHVPVEEADDSVSENIPAADSKEILVSGEHVGADMSSPADISVAPCVVGSVIKENGERKLSSIKNKVGTSVALVDAVVEEEPIVQSVDKTVTVLDSKECLTQQNDDRRTSPKNAHSDTTEDEKTSGVTEVLCYHSSP